MRSPPTYVHLNFRFRFCPRRHRKITSSFFFSLVHWTSKRRSEWCEFDSLNTLKLSYGKQSLHFQYYQSLISAKYISVLSSPGVSSEFPPRARVFPYSPLSKFATIRRSWQCWCKIHTALTCVTED